MPYIEKDPRLPRNSGAVRGMSNPRLAEIVRWRDEQRPNVDDFDIDGDASVTLNQPRKVKWKQKRVDSLVIAEKSVKVRERVQCQQRMLDQEINHLEYLQFRAVKNVDNKMAHIRSEINSVSNRISIPLRQLQIPPHKEPPVLHAQGVHGGKGGHKGKKPCPSTFQPPPPSQPPLPRERYGTRPSLAIGIRLNEIPEKKEGGAISKPPLGEKRQSIFGDIFVVSPSESPSLRSSEQTPRSGWSRVSSRCGKQRPHTAVAAIGRTDGYYSVEHERIRSAQHPRHQQGAASGLVIPLDPGSMTELNDYNKQRTTWCSTF